MPEPEDVFQDSDACALAIRWRVAWDTMWRVVEAAQRHELKTGRRVRIISGFRTKAEQDRLRKRGRPAAAEDRSTHRSCPATGVDISLGFAPSRFQIVTWGHTAIRVGLRWGGGGPVQPVEPGVPAGIPVDWQHVDRGPRK